MFSNSLVGCRLRFPGSKFDGHLSILDRILVELYSVEEEESLRQKIPEGNSTERDIFYKLASREY